RLYAERGLGAARAGIAYFRERLPQAVTDPSLRAELAQAGEEGAEDLESFAAFLSDLCAGAQGDWAISEARYTGLLNQRELLASSAADLAAAARGVWEEVGEQMAELARRIDPAADSWQVVAEFLSRRHPGDPDDMRLAYERSVALARSFLVERELVTLAEGEFCSVEPSPPFRRPLLAVASYSGPPPFRGGRQGHFFVPFPPEGTTPEQLEQRLSDNSFAAIPTISVHEAYPGHHWHMSWSAAQPRPVRKTFRTPYFVEGWALYAEALMREQGFFSDAGEELLHLGMRLFRAVRVVVDTGLHSGELTREEAVSTLMSGAGLTEAVARAEVGRYCAWPTQASSYLTGALEIEAARARWLADHPGELRGFHDGIAASPGIPVALAERSLLAATR
ncbi:MAG: DUF885 domain-containing protein, partial [Acidimicrobiales bacterium]